MAELAGWDSFYVILGSAAGALIGLQFVVMTLIAERPKLRQTAEAGAAFSSPTIVHFCVVLFLSALLRAPWQTLTAAAVLWGIVGLCGVAYSAVVVRHMRSQHAYRPDLEDWSFYLVLPLLAYAALAVCAILSRSHTHAALFGVGAATLLLLFAGIHNSWDIVVYHVFKHGD